MKNYTIYKGSIRFKLEKMPFYSKGGSDVLNKIHLDLGFIKLVSRVKVSEYDWSKIELVKQNTNLDILIGGWVESKDANCNVTGVEFQENKWDPTASLSQIIVATKKGNFVGGIEVGWWFYQEKLKADDVESKIAFKEDSKSWIGMLVGVAVPFTYGNKVFDPKWTGGLSAAKLELIPFNQRGDKTITTLDEARQAAINFSNFKPY